LASIVLVDDDIDIVNLFEHFLKIQGHRILGKAFDGEEAISVVTSLTQKPDIILMDHRMPQISGLQATKSINNSFPDIKIVVVSADMKVKQQAKDNGASAFLLKPISFKSVLATIQELINGKNLL
jgi:CheY-like chemotaxis protein